MPSVGATTPIRVLIASPPYQSAPTADTVGADSFGFSSWTSVAVSRAEVK